MQTTNVTVVVRVRRAEHLLPWEAGRVQPAAHREVLLQNGAVFCFATFLRGPNVVNHTAHCLAAAFVVRIDDDATIQELTGKIMQLGSNCTAGIVRATEPCSDPEHTASIVEVSGLLLHFNQVTGCLVQQFLLMYSP